MDWPLYLEDLFRAQAAPILFEINNRTPLLPSLSTEIESCTNLSAITIALSGDALITRPLMPFKEEAFLGPRE